jgi:hypothetical protein
MAPPRSRLARVDVTTKNHVAGSRLAHRALGGSTAIWGVYPAYAGLDSPASCGLCLLELSDDSCRALCRGRLVLVAAVSDVDHDRLLVDSRLAETTKLCF